ncbi:MAG: DUF5334 domain-containing protein [Desulfovibrio sp.]|jgi:hypothetical protein|nr:DUF5334 domain-containing protein [Desulfovibrio sp.]
MRNLNLCFGIFFAGLAWLPQATPAWDGFDAATAGLVEIIPDSLPSRGDTVDVRNYDSDTTQTCLVENVTQNSRTVEVLVRWPDGGTRMLIMEGR